MDELQEVYVSALVMFYHNRNISEFERRQKALQDAWIKADEIKALDVFYEEKKELERSTMIQEGNNVNGKRKYVKRKKKE